MPLQNPLILHNLNCRLRREWLGNREDLAVRREQFIALALIQDAGPVCQLPVSLPYTWLFLPRFWMLSTHVLIWTGSKGNFSFYRSSISEDIPIGYMFIL